MVVDVTFKSKLTETFVSQMVSTNPPPPLPLKYLTFNPSNSPLQNVVMSFPEPAAVDADPTALLLSSKRAAGLYTADPLEIPADDHRMPSSLPQEHTFLTYSRYLFPPLKHLRKEVHNIST